MQDMHEGGSGQKSGGPGNLSFEEQFFGVGNVPKVNQVLLEEAKQNQKQKKYPNLPQTKVNQLHDPLLGGQSQEDDGGVIAGPNAQPTTIYDEDFVVTREKKAEGGSKCLVIYCTICALMCFSSIFILFYAKPWCGKINCLEGKPYIFDAPKKCIEPQQGYWLDVLAKYSQEKDKYPDSDYSLLNKDINEMIAGPCKHTFIQMKDDMWYFVNWKNPGKWGGSITIDLVDLKGNVEQMMEKYIDPESEERWISGKKDGFDCNMHYVDEQGTLWFTANFGSVNALMTYSPYGNKFEMVGFNLYSVRELFVHEREMYANMDHMVDSSPSGLYRLHTQDGSLENSFFKLIVQFENFNNIFALKSQISDNMQFNGVDVNKDEHFISASKATIMPEKSVKIDDEVDQTQGKSPRKSTFFLFSEQYLQMKVIEVYFDEEDNVSDQKETVFILPLEKYSREIQVFAMNPMYSYVIMIDRYGIYFNKLEVDKQGTIWYYSRQFSQNSQINIFDNKVLQAPPNEINIFQLREAKTYGDHIVVKVESYITGNDYRQRFMQVSNKVLESMFNTNRMYLGKDEKFFMRMN